MAIGTPASLAAGHGSATPSVSPTSGAFLYLAVWAKPTLDSDDYDEIITVSGLSGTWERLGGTLIKVGNGRNPVAFYECKDWSGSGTVSFTYAGDSTVESDFGYSLIECTGVSSERSYVGLTEFTTGNVNVQTNDAADLDIGWDTNETAPTNAVSICFFWNSEIANDGDFAALSPAPYDDTNWSLLTSSEEDGAGGNRFIETLYSTNGDATPALESVTGSALGYHAAGFWLVEDGSEPAEWAVRELKLDESQNDDGTNVQSLADWSLVQQVGSGVAQHDNHSDHGPARVIDLTTTNTSCRLSHLTQLSGADQWTSAKWFMDRSTTALNVYNLFLRGSDGDFTEAYQFRFTKQTQGSQRNDLYIELFERTADVSTEIASISSFTPARTALNADRIDDAIVLYADVKGSILRVYVDGVLKLTHDTTGDTNVHTTGGYAGFDPVRDESSTSSQPFSYGWQAGTFAEPAGGPATVNAVADADWSGWTASATSEVDVSSSASAAWGGWTAEASAVVEGVEVTAVADATWSGWTATATSEVEITLSASAGWGGWDASASADVEVAAVADATWSGWTGTASSEVEVTLSASADWSGWTGAASADVGVTAQADAAWVGWAGVASSEVEIVVNASANWAGWTAEGSGNVSHTSTADAIWGGWNAAMSADVESIATGSADWGGWSALATATIEGEVTANAVWSGWDAQASAEIDIDAVADATWLGWSAVAASDVEIVVSGDAAWAGWDAQAAAVSGGVVTASADWSGWSGVVSAETEVTATASTTWSGWTASALADAEGEVQAVASATWSGWAAVAFGPGGIVIEVTGPLTILPVGEDFTMAEIGDSRLMVVVDAVRSVSEVDPARSILVQDEELSLVSLS